MALPTLDATFASSADLPRKQMLAKWLVEELGETQAPSDVLVSGAGTITSDGIYTLSGQENGKNKYVLGDNYIAWQQLEWRIFDAITYGDILYVSSDDTEFPWQATFITSNGDEPTPTVTEISYLSPLSNYYSLPERYLWAKIAVAAGAPRSEADYISLPTRYVWSDIYNAVSGDIAQSTVAVSGLGDSQYNGNYVYDGDFDGRPSYRLSLDVQIFWENLPQQWVLNAEGNMAPSLSNVAYPWLATGWINDGLDPTGLVLTPQTPNHTDWSENVALGHIAAAYRGDTTNPANLATYIDWPWRYKVAAIIQAL